MSFKEEIATLSRQELLEMIRAQDEREGNEREEQLIFQINRIEWVFRNRLNHLNWSDGTPILERDLTNEELALLIDAPFEYSDEYEQLGLDEDQQRQIHIAKDPVLWAKYFLGAKPRVYQILILRDPSTRKVLRAGRRLGKTFCLALLMLHYCYTHQYGKVLIVAPMKEQADLIYKELLKLINSSEAASSSVQRKVTSPQYSIELVNGSTMKFFTSGLKSGGKCLTPDHDVLSEDGWKPISEIVVGEKVMAWRPNDDGEYYWGEVSDTQSYDFDGELVVHYGKQISFRSTPNHKFITKNTYSNTKWKEIDADKLKSYFLPTGAYPAAGTRFNFSPEELELWGWWLAEGSGFIGNLVRLSQVKPEGRERIITLAKDLGLKCLKYKREIRVEWRPPIFSGTNCYDKFIPRELMDEVGRSHLLSGLLGGDGWMRRKGWEYSSSSYQLINDVQELAVRMGLRANLREKKTIKYVPVNGGLPNPHWIVSGYDYKKSILNPHYLKRESYKGDVYCITIPESGFFLTRHNGLVHVTGNSDIVRGQEAHVIILDELDYMHRDDLVAIYAMLQKTAAGQEDKILIGASTPTGRKEVFYNWCTSANSQFTEFYYPSYCFTAEQKVVMADGSYRNIDSIQVGEFVRTERGPQRVIKTFERDYDGEIIDLVVYGNNTTISVTPEHPFSSCTRNYKQVPSYKGRKVGYDWKWLDSKELKEPQCRNLNSGSLLRYVYSNKIIDTPIDVASMSDHFIVKEERVWVDRIFKAGRKFINSLPQYISMYDESLATIVGWFLAEGSLSGWNKHYNLYTVVEWSISIEELWVVDIIQMALDKLDAGKLSLSPSPERGGLKLNVYNTPLAVLLKHLCGTGSKTKEISSEIVYAPESFQQKMIESYGGGDGWEYRPGCFDIRTSSGVLARQIRDVCARLGWIPSIAVADSTPCHANKKHDPYECAPSWLIEYRPTGRSMLGKRFTSISGEAAFLVKKIRSRQFKGKVYNLEVEKTNTYLVEGLLVHNCSPYFDKKAEEEFRHEYTEMQYRHEIEADWGEDSEGVYTRKYVDIAFNSGKLLKDDATGDELSKLSDWKYVPNITADNSFFVIGVDWDKYGAGTNIVILEVCDSLYPDSRAAGRIRCAYREEIPKSEYTFTIAIERIIVLNQIFQPRHIYVDRGAGEVQLETLHKHGLDHPESKLRDRVKGISFSETLEIQDVATRQMVKKHIKPYMVDNLSQMLEREQIAFSSSDTELYHQLISYVVVRTSIDGRPVFEASGTAVDHAHDALILAALAITQNYGDMHSIRVARRSVSISNRALLPIMDVGPIDRNEIEDMSKAPILVHRTMTVKMNKNRPGKPIGRKKF